MTETPAEARAPRYAWYVLGVLFLVYILNFIDRQVLSILAEDIKRDLGLADEDIGFLYGTAFGVFYALFGIPLGRLADTWHRVRLLTVGLALWSVMTALSGLSRTGAHLAAARVGVGVGEASAGPAAYSLISDWFPKRLRATALSIYSAGLYIGGGVSLGIGGLIVQSWDRAYPYRSGPFELAGWQVAFLSLGLPGLLVAAWVATLREPPRGLSEKLPPTPPHPAPFRGFFAELLTVLPPLTLIAAAQGGARSLLVNLLAAAIAIGAVMLLVALGEPVAQWTAVAIGFYAVFSWAQALRRRDPPTFALIAGNPAFLCVVVAYALNAFLGYSASFWGAPYAMRELGASPATAGFILGGAGALGGFVGVTLGGIVADRLRQRHAAGRVYVVVFGTLAPVIPLLVAYTAQDLTLFYWLAFPTQALASCALGAAAATGQDLVLPRMRGTATAAAFIGNTLLGLALGPYLAGRVSTLTGDLATGVLALLLVTPIALAAGIMAIRLVPEAERTMLARARAAGEPI